VHLAGQHLCTTRALVEAFVSVPSLVLLAAAAPWVQPLPGVLVDAVEAPRGRADRDQDGFAGSGGRPHGQGPLSVARRFSSLSGRAGRRG
jgi:hypothetical protein